MSYKIAIASSNNREINLTFGEAKEFIIYEVQEDGTYNEIKRRAAENDSTLVGLKQECGNGCGNGHGGCSSGGESNVLKAELVSDCRCVICKKIGFRVLKQLEKKAITAFDVECDISEALNKIIAYIHRIDHHETLRGTHKEKGDKRDEYSE